MRRLCTSLLLGALAACADGPASTDADPDVLTSTERPSKRSEVLAAPDEEGATLMIFGGNDGPVVDQRAQAVFRNDTWLFTPGVGWEEVPTEVSPSKRGRYALGHDPENRRVLLFAGRFRAQGADGTDPYEVFNDLWSFDFTTRTWTELHDGSGEAPTGRYYPSGAYDTYNRRFYAWGGATNRSSTVIETSDELWSWSEEDGWQTHETTGEAPSQRTFLGDAYDPTRNRLIIFGGQVGDFFSLAYNDLYALDLDDFTWERLHDGSTGRAPSTRMHAALEYDAINDRYVLFGGHTDLGDANDLWAFDPEGGEWSVLVRGDKFTGERLGCIGNESEVPADYVEQDLSAPERRHRGMHAMLGDSLWIAGGMHSECSDHLDDTWRFDLTTDTWVEVLEARSGESCARRGDDCQCLCL